MMPAEPNGHGEEHPEEQSEKEAPAPQSARPLDAWCQRCEEYTPLVALSEVHIVSAPLGAAIVILRCERCGLFIAPGGSLSVQVQQAPKPQQMSQAIALPGMRLPNRADPRRMGLS